MKRRVVKTVSILLAATLLTACGGTASAGNATKPSETESSVVTESEVVTAEEAPVESTSSVKWEMSKAGTIEETILYDEDGLKITATEIEYTSHSVEVSLSIENSSDKNLSVVSGSLGYSCNAVNGYMVSDGYVNADVNAGKKAAETVSFSYDELLAYGITEIADIEFGFDISDDDYNHTYTEALKLETSLAATHDYETDTYPDAIQSAEAADALKFKLEKFDTECLYDKGGFKMLSSYVSENRDGDKAVIMEFENTNDKMLYVVINDICVNGLLVSSGRWDSQAIIGHHKGFLTLNAGRVLNKDYYKNLGFDEISEIAMDITINKQDGTEMELPEHVSINLKDGVSYETSGTEVYNDHDIRIVSKGVLQETSDYSPDIHILMIVENNGSEEISVGDSNDSFSINDYMVDCYLYTKYIAPGTAALLDIEVPDNNFDDAKIEKVEDINSAEITLEIRNDAYKMIDEPTIKFEMAQ